MILLEWFPQQPHHLLEADGRTLTAGDTFEVSEEDAQVLLGNPDIRASRRALEAPVASEEALGKQEPSQTHSPGRAERTTTTDRRP